MDSLSNLLTILQTNQAQAKLVAIIPYSKLSETFLLALQSENLINTYIVQYISANQRYTKNISFMAKMAHTFTTPNIRKKLPKNMHCFSKLWSASPMTEVINDTRGQKQSFASHFLHHRVMHTGAVSATQKKKLKLPGSLLCPQWKKKSLVVFLRYEKNIPTLYKFIRVSKPGRRIYYTHEFLKKNAQSFQILFLSTAYGIISDRKALTLGVGGELLCKILF